VRRNISLALLQDVLDRPEQIVDVRQGRKAYQSRHVIDGKTYLVRAIVDIETQPPVVVTVYRTSKIAKYWRSP
jgi:hypothetical protein